jgi:hypothetical protein
VLQTGLEVLNVVGDRQELEDLDALALRVAIPLAILGDDPFSLPEDAAELSVTCLSLRFSPLSVSFAFFLSQLIPSRPKPCTCGNESG